MHNVEKWSKMRCLHRKIFKVSFFNIKHQWVTVSKTFVVTAKQDTNKHFANL